MTIVYLKEQLIVKGEIFFVRIQSILSYISLDF